MIYSEGPRLTAIGQRSRPAGLGRPDGATPSAAQAVEAEPAQPQALPRPGPFPYPKERSVGPGVLNRTKLA